jgi:SlyX protein
MTRMNDLQALVARIEALEMRIAYQDETIEELNQTITSQWSKIDGLIRQVAQLGDRVSEAENRAGAAAPQVPPPHY